MGSDNIESIYALSPMQEGMLYHKIRNEDSTEYFIRYEIKLTGKWEHSYLRESLDLLAERYEILRTAFVMPKKGDRPLQLILRDRKPEMKVIDLSVEAKESLSRRIENIMEKDLNRGFDLKTDSLLRMTVIKLSEEERIALWSLHHIILDGWCCSSVLTDFFRIYETLLNGVTAPQLRKEFAVEKTGEASYHEYIKWLDRQDKKAALNYWSKMLEDYTDITEISPLKKPGKTRNEMERFTKKADKAFTEKLLKVAKVCGVTVNTVLESALGVLLQRYIRKNDVVFGKVVSGRNADIAGIDKAVGLFINTVPVRVRTVPEMNFAELLKAMHQQSLESVVYEYCSLADIQSQSKVKNDLIKILFVYENYYVEKNGVTKEKKKLDSNLKIEITAAREQTNYPLNFSVSMGETLELDIIYNPRLFHEEDVKLILKRYDYVLTQLVENPDSKISGIEVVDRQERDTILNQFSFTCRKENSGQTVVELLEQQAEKRSQKVALASKGREITYGELNEKANELAYQLRDRGVKRDDFVAVMAERRMETIIAICAVIKAGGAYVPVNPEYPEERVKYILEDCAPKALIDFKEKKINGISVIDISTILNWKGRQENPVRVNRENDLLYVIYTSGTTGKPKGAMIEQRNAVNLVKDTNYVDLNSETVILQTGALSFDAATFEIWGALLNGGRLFLTESCDILDIRSLKKILNKNNINTMFLTTALFNQLITYDETVFDGLKYLMIGGEKASEYHVMKLAGRNSRLLFYNVYGPTETTTFATWYPISQPLQRKIPIGKPIKNAAVYIMNEGKLCGTGMAGELCIGGRGVARGYLNNKKLTDEKFIDNPYGEGKLYRTGDLARWLPDGNIEFLGRIDEQVKIRGFRIEPGEIESLIRETDGIEDAAVIVREHGEDKRIEAYIVSRRLEAKELLEALKKELPSYMCPSAIQKIDGIPLNPNGKVDKKALPEIEYQYSEIITEPINQMEEIILDIFKGILERDSISTRDNFFEIGGHSLKAVRLINKMEAATGVRLSLNDFFAKPTVKALAKKITASSSQYSEIPVAAKQDTYTMSPAQKRIFVLNDYDNTGIAYNMYNGMEIEGELDFHKLQKAYEGLVRRHEILRTGFYLKDGIGFQKIFENIQPKIEYQETKEMKEEDKVRYMKNFIRSFDLRHPPLFRIKFIKANKGNDLILFDMHHIISDGVTIKILISDLEKLYKDEPLKPLSIFYKDYSQWLKKRDLSDQKAYWLSVFSGETPVLNLPLDYKRPKVQTFRGNTLKLNLSHKIREQIGELCRKTNTTEFMVMMSVFMVLLGKYSRQEEIVIGSPVSGRVHKDTEGIAGMFVNTIAVKGFPCGKKTFCSFLEEMKHQIIKAQENQEYPFDELVEEVAVNRDMSRNPLFDVLLSMQNKDMNTELQLPGARLKDIPMPRDISKFDLSLFVIITEEGYELEAEYCSELFTEQSIQRMMLHFINILKEVLKEPDKIIKHIDVTDRKERLKLLKEFNRSSVNYEKDITVIRLFEQMVSEYPDKEAVFFEQMSLTYKELNDKANALAQKLRSMGVGRDDFVAVMARRRIETIIGMAAILKAGGAYVPLDPNYPADRTKYIMKDCSPKAILNYASDNDFGLPFIDLSSMLKWEGKKENPKPVNTSGDLIYLIYTSGTSGKPKGAMIEHKSVIRLVNKADFVNLNENTVILQTGTLCFDAATFEVWGALLNGGTLYLADNEIIMNPNSLRTMIQNEKINTMWLTVSLFNQLVIENPHIFDSLKNLLIGGEKISEKHVSMLRENNKDIRIINGYGPTETTTFAATYPITDYPMQDNTPIGRPIHNTQVYIVNEDTLCGIGMIGEIFIAGDGVARGYLNQPELTDKSFITNPYGSGKLYRSGDLGRWREDGNIEYAGRADEQVKLRGFRIELKEIERVISKYQGIQDAVVVMKEEHSNKWLLGYIVATNKVDIGKLRDEIKKELPDYMIPSGLLQIKKIPVTRNGKTDIRALPEIEFTNRHDYVAPRNETEKKIIQVFEDVLGYSPVGMQDNFFEIGGDSIKAIRLISKLKDLNYSISLREIIQLREVSLIAGSLKRVENQLEYSQEEITGSFQLSPIQTKFFRWNLSNPNHFNQCLMLKTEKPVDIEAVKQSFQALTKHHDMLRGTFSKGVQTILRTSERNLFDLSVYDVEKYKGEGRLSFIEKKNTKIQSSMDLERGPLVKAAVYLTSKESHILICIHHLVVDGVSWRIILEDFENGYKQYIQKGQIRLPEKSMAYREWINVHREYCSSVRVKAQLPYWKQLRYQFTYGRLKRDGDTTNPGYEIIKFNLNQEQTKHLRYHASRYCKGNMNVLLLTSLGLACRSMYGRDKILVQVEGHGREEFSSKVCVSRTVGWFTTIYPVLIEVLDSVEDTLMKTKEMLDSIPDYGMGYDLLLEEEGDEADITFNYLGEIRREEKNDSFFVKSEYPAGTAVEKENIFSNIIFNSLIDNGQLKMELWYDKLKFANETMHKLLYYYEKALKKVIEHCLQIGFESNYLENGKKEKNVRVTSNNIFALKKYDKEALMGTGLYHDLLDYERQMTKQKESTFKPFGYQKFFFVNYPENICAAKIRLEGDIEPERVIQIVREIIKEQSIFRISYDSKNETLCQYRFTEECKVPYVINTKSHFDESLYESVIVHSELFRELLSKVFLVKRSENCHEIYFFVHHGLWDLASTEILGELIKEKCMGINPLNIKDAYTQYTMERVKREELDLSRPDQVDLMQRFFSYAQTFDSLYSGKTEKYQIHIKFRFDAGILERILKDPIQLAMYLYTRINMNKISVEAIPFLLMHFGREDTGMKTPGLYLDIIPQIYQAGNIQKYARGPENCGHLLFRKKLFDTAKYKQYFKRFPVVNFYADLETDNIFENCKDIDIQVKKIVGGNEITMRIFKDIVYIAIPSIHNNVSQSMEILNEILE